MQHARSIVLISCLAAAGFAGAGEVKAFQQEVFARLTKAGKPVLLEVTATWCPTCKQQKPIVDALMRKPSFKDVTLLIVDFDSSKKVLAQFNIGQQSTLVAFKGLAEVGRSIGDTRPAGIEGLITKTLN
jgi:thioredoxin 1